VCSLNPTPVHHLVLAWARARLYVVAVVMSGVVEALTSIARSFPGKEHACSRSGGSGSFVMSRGVSRWDITPAALCQVVLFSNVDKARKTRDLMGACSPITPPMSVGLGGSMAVALNALTSVPAKGGGERFCARGLLIRSTLFPYLTVAGYRALGRSLCRISVFKAMVDIVSWFKPRLW